MIIHKNISLEGKVEFDESTGKPKGSASTKIGISVNAIQKHIDKLKINNKIRRGGPATRGGYWVILPETDLLGTNE